MLNRTTGVTALEAMIALLIVSIVSLLAFRMLASISQQKNQDRTLAVITEAYRAMELELAGDSLSTGDASNIEMNKQPAGDLEWITVSCTDIRNRKLATLHCLRRGVDSADSR